jgi:hypothetical protein
MRRMRGWMMVGCLGMFSVVRAAGPAIVVEVSSVNALVEAMSTAGTALGQPQLPPAALHGMLGGAIHAPGLAGLDLARPVQLCIFLPALKPGEGLDDLTPTMAAVLPLQGDGATYSALLGSMFEKAEAVDGVRHLSSDTHPGSLDMVIVGNRAVVGDDPDAVKALQKQIASKAAAGPMVDFAGTLRVKLNMAACTPYVEAGINEMLAAMKEAPMPPEMPMDPIVMLEAERDGLLMLMRELASYSLGLDISADAITCYDRVVPRSGTKTASWVGGLKRPADRYMSALPEGAPLAAVGSGMDVMDQIGEPYADLMERIYAAMGAPMDKMGGVMGEMLRKFKGVYSGDMAWGLVPGADGKSLGMVEMIALGDPDKAIALIDQFYKEFGETAGAAMPGLAIIENPSRTYNGITIRSFAYSVDASKLAAPGMEASMASMKWVDGMQWEMAVVGNELLYTLAPSDVMNAALTRLAKGTKGVPLDQSPAFTRLFPKMQGEPIELHTLSLARLIKLGLAAVPGVDAALVATIPDGGAGIAGYSIVKDGELIGLERVSFDEVKALQVAFPVIGASGPALMKLFGVPVPEIPMAPEAVME